MNNEQIKIKEWKVTDEECRNFMENMVKEAFNNEEETTLKKVNRNKFITDLIEQEAYKAKVSKLRLMSNTKNIVDIHIISNEIALIEEYYKHEDKNYFMPIVNEKKINCLFDSFDKALIGALAHKYKCEDFAYKAIISMFGIQDDN